MPQERGQLISEDGKDQHIKEHEFDSSTPYLLSQAEQLLFFFPNETIVSIAPAGSGFLPFPAKILNDQWM